MPPLVLADAELEAVRPREEAKGGAATDTEPLAAQRSGVTAPRLNNVRPGARPEEKDPGYVQEDPTVPPIVRQEEEVPLEIEYGRILRANIRTIAYCPRPVRSLLAETLTRHLKKTFSSLYKDSETVWRTMGIFWKIIFRPPDAVRGTSFRRKKKN
jgi:hypothetical protein